MPISTRRSSRSATPRPTRPACPSVWKQINERSLICLPANHARFPWQHWRRLPKAVGSGPLLHSLRHKPLGVFLQNAAIHNNFHAGGTGTLGSLLMDDAFLHPHHLGALGDRRLHYFRDKLRTPENDHNVKRFRHVGERGVALLTQYKIFHRVHGYNSIASLLHVFGNAMTRPHELRREPHNGERFVMFENFANGIGHGYYGSQKSGDRSQIRAES